MKLKLLALKQPWTAESGASLPTLENSVGFVGDKEIKAER